MAGSGVKTVSHFTGNSLRAILLPCFRWSAARRDRIPCPKSGVICAWFRSVPTACLFVCKPSMLVRRNHEFVTVVFFGDYRASAGVGHAASLPTLDHSSKADADGRNRPGFMTSPGSSPALMAATAITPTGEMSSLSHGRCSVPTAWWWDRVAW
jgi:hypothetical protein